MIVSSCAWDTSTGIVVIEVHTRWANLDEKSTMTNPQSDVSVTVAPTSSVSPVCGITPRWRRAEATTLLAAGILWLVPDVIAVGWSPPAAGVARYEWYIDHPRLASLGLAADLLAIPFLVFTVGLWLALSRVQTPRLAWTGAVLGVFGLVGQTVISGAEMAEFMVVQAPGISLPAVDQAFNGGGNAGGIAFALFFVMFFVGCFAGTSVAMIGLWRAGTVPRGAVVAWMAFLALSLTGLPSTVPKELMSLISLGWMAWSLLRSPRRLPRLSQ